MSSILSSPFRLACAFRSKAGSCLYRQEVDHQRRVKFALSLMHIPGRVRRQLCPSKPIVHWIVNVTVDPQRRLIPIEDSIKVRGERAVEWIVVKPPPDRPAGQRVVCDCCSRCPSSVSSPEFKRVPPDRLGVS